MKKTIVALLGVCLVGPVEAGVRVWGSKPNEDCLQGLIENKVVNTENYHQVGDGIAKLGRDKAGHPSVQVMVTGGGTVTDGRTCKQDSSSDLGDALSRLIRGAKAAFANAAKREPADTIIDGPESKAAAAKFFAQKKAFEEVLAICAKADDSRIANAAKDYLEQGELRSHRSSPRAKGTDNH